MIEYGYRKKGSVKHYKYKRIDTFVLTNDIEMIKKDANVNCKDYKTVKVRQVKRWTLCSRASMLKVNMELLIIK